MLQIEGFTEPTEYTHFADKLSSILRELKYYRDCDINDQNDNNSIGSFSSLGSNQSSQRKTSRKPTDKPMDKTTIAFEIYSVLEKYPNAPKVMSMQNKDILKTQNFIKNTLGYKDLSDSDISNIIDELRRLASD
jgi:hypothetical protein